MPDGFREEAAAADERLLTRRSPPRVRIERSADGWEFSSPYADDEAQDWAVLLCDAFGTRHVSLVVHFLNRITELVPGGDWDAEKQVWYPDETEFNAALAIISALRPENEAQAAYAAQLLALDRSAHKLGQYTAKYGGDPRSLATLARTTRAFGEGLERLAKVQGRIQPRTVHQTIQVIHVDNRSVNQFNGGGASDGGQPHGATRGETVPRAALPSPRQVVGEGVPLSSRERQAGVPRSWWGSRLWRALRRSQRAMEARRLDA